MAHKHGVPVIVDNTVATPVLIRPIDYGADIVVYSLTKYMGGHGNSLGGAIVDSGQFPWEQISERFPMLNLPEPSYHGVVYTKEMGPAAYIARARTVPLRNTGAAISPLNAFLISAGDRDVGLADGAALQQCAGRGKLSERTPKVAWVHYAGLPASPYYELAQKYTGGKPSGLLTFGIQGGFEAGGPILRRPATVQAACQHRGCQIAGSAPGFDHASSAIIRGTGVGRCHSRHDSPLCRYRTYRRHYRGP